MKTMRNVTNFISAILIFIYTAGLFVKWNDIPLLIPTHFNTAGTPDKYGSKISLIFELVFAILIFVFFAIIERYPKFWNMPVTVTEENKDRLYFVSALMIGILKVLIVPLMLYIGIVSAFQFVSIIPVFVLTGLMLLVTLSGIVIMIKLK